MKRFLAFALLLTFLAGAGVAGWLFFGQGMAIASDGEGGEPGAEDPGAPIYVDLDPLVLPVIGRKGVEQILALAITLDVQGAEARVKVRQHQPRLVDAFIKDLYEMTDRRRASAGAALDIEGVKTRLAEASARVLGEGVVREVLIKSVSQRPI